MEPGQCAGCMRRIPDTVISFEMACNRHIACERCMQSNTRNVANFMCPVDVCAGKGHPQPPQSHHQEQNASENVVPSPSDSAIKLAKMQSRMNEPLHPLSTQRSGATAFFAGVLDKIGSLADRNKPDTQARNPFVLLDQRIPLTELVTEHGMDITELINDHGLNVNDFFLRGYTMAHMCEAFGSRMNKKDGLRVLCALGMSPDHFAKVPQYVQEPVLREKLGYEPSWLLSLGYAFEPNKDTLPQLLQLGMSMPLVMKAGLRTKSQWEFLKNTAITPQQIAQFGWNKQLDAQLLLDLPLNNNVHQAPQYVQQQMNYVDVAPPTTITNEARSDVHVVAAIDPRTHPHVQVQPSVRNTVPRLRSPGEVVNRQQPVLVVMRK